MMLPSLMRERNRKKRQKKKKKKKYENKNCVHLSFSVVFVINDLIKF